MSLRSLAAQSLSARQKSQLRKFAFQFGGYRMRRVEAIVDQLVREDGARSFLQIGANDGYMSDPLNLAIFRHGLRGAFVEPQANYHRELQNTYRGLPGLRYVQKAIASEAGHMTMFSLDCSSGRLPRWARGVGTLSADQIRKFGDQIPDIESYIRSQDVPCCTVPELLAEIDERDPDIVVVDAEGLDYAILSQFDFAALTTKLVIYETESMEAGDIDALSVMFVRCGFALLSAGQDTVAIRKTTRSWRSMGVEPAAADITQR
ncbi:FkbM family methyltransferase [Tardiphaga alba]|uniref:FkbM family methyltransferase n=1 Tax=Tardiphaga alba TaxID=340268 RepID=A0ABX8A4E7_9BRAD|nr:FkbM family methyltransferase [Tardiphaga alba]QUS38544.1 FkbM family methyltransferase [Tardiphaga alba]